MIATAGRYSWNQELTITVETPTSEVSGSSVSAVSWRKQWIRWDGMGWSYDLTGEAVVVEVTPGRYLFALLKGAGTTEYRICRKLCKWTDEDFEVVVLRGQRCELGKGTESGRDLALADHVRDLDAFERC